MAQELRETVAKTDETNETEVADEAVACRLSDLRRRQEVTQHQLATVMGVRQPRVSQLESADLCHVEVATLRAYILALGGRLRVVAEFGDDHLTLEH